jgi:hypothetical protein
MTDHWFWLLLTGACVLWYSTITVYVAFKGIKDIRGMLERLNKKKTDREAAESSTVPGNRR